jgi:hypothetical protein
MTASSRCLLFPRPCDPFNFGEVKVTTRQQFRPCVPFDPPIRPDLIPFPQLRGELGQSARGGGGVVDYSGEQGTTVTSDAVSGAISVPHKSNRRRRPSVGRVPRGGVRACVRVVALLNRLTFNGGRFVFTLHSTKDIGYLVDRAAVAPCRTPRHPR